MIQNLAASAPLLQPEEGQHVGLLEILQQACKKIAPVWPLESFVAVNPFLGFTDKRFHDTAQELAVAGGIQMTMPVSFYLKKIQEKKISHEDLATILQRHHEGKPVSVNTFLNSLPNADEEELTQQLATVADVATQLTSQDWNRLVTARITAWAASYFDKGQAHWVAADQSQPLFAAWRAEALQDRTPELMGLKGFRRAVQTLPTTPVEAAQQALTILGIPEESLPLYLHRLLLSVGGWSAYAAYLDWTSKLYHGQDGKLIEFLAVLLSWEACLLTCLQEIGLTAKWQEVCALRLMAGDLKEPNQLLAAQLILQEAFDLGMQRSLILSLKSLKTPDPTELAIPKVQAVFCIDVRSEVFRRNLELANQHIETLGFAGFFAFPVNYISIGHTQGRAQCPVLLKTGVDILEEIPDKETHQTAVASRLQHRRSSHLWTSFKSGAVTCFSFVSPMGLSYLPKLFTDSFGFTRPVPHPDNVGLKADFIRQKGIRLSLAKYQDQPVGILLEQQAQMAKNALKAMSLTGKLANLVLLVGHGSTTVNNPHATGLDCGACGGHTGEANAKVAVAVLNNKEVRRLLAQEKINIPTTTVFLACLHDTTTDEVTIFNQQDVPENLQPELADLKKSLSLAGHTSRTERAIQMSMNGQTNIDAAIKARSKDWSQTRPEWGLAGCSAFVVAPRARTKDLNLGGRSFLHSYDWKKDEGFGVLELIMTAPMVVTSWINLQYYASTVDNRNLGAGNKTLHNVTAGLGVLEGFTGDLRVGLPWQSVHNGEEFQHDPLKLNVFIEAPIEAMNTILKKNLSVKNLCDNSWIYLLALNDEGKPSHRYIGDLMWEEVA